VAHRTLGVLDVANNITVRDAYAKGRTDTELASAVRFALEWDVMVPDQRIQSTVSNGIVTLMGTVDNLRERDDAMRAVRNLMGVHSVINGIVVKAAPVQPSVVKERIESALSRHAERRASQEADRIAVDVRGGKVTLTGTIESWQEDQAVRGAVSHIPGVEKVDDQLRISHYV
jgi:osmotically-inducible protein OsmY